MSEIKFLGDGRKVVVLGKINNNEYIVQEIFVTEKGDEVSSGENFTTKNLHDIPVESYLKREEKIYKQHVDNEKKDLEHIKIELKKYKSLLLARKDMLANSPELKHLVGNKANILAMFMTGTVNYIVSQKNYSLIKPETMEEYIIKWDKNWGNIKYDGIKLVSVLGNSKGDLEYRIHRYSDGSGGC